MSNRKRMTTYTKILLVLTTLMLVGFRWANAGNAPEQAEVELRTFCSRVMQSVASGDLPAAYELLANASVLPEETFRAAARNTSQKRDKAFRAHYGRTVGYQFLSYEVAGSLRRLVYLERTERVPLVWRFVFYRAPQGWVLLSYGWDDKLLSVFKGHQPRGSSRHAPSPPVPSVSPASSAGTPAAADQAGNRTDVSSQSAANPAGQ